MARISSYPQDITVQDTDAWIGSDSTTRATKQYTAAAVAKYLNIKGKISISAQMVFKYELNGASAGDFTGPADGSALTAITTMQLSTADSSGQDVIIFMEYLVGNNILISEQNDISKFGHFTVNSYTVSAAGFYTLNLTNIGGNGNLTDKLFYDFAVFTLPSPFQFNTTSASGIESPTNTASGGFSTAMGRETTASGESSTAIGRGTNATGIFSTAVGLLTVASGNRSTAMGAGTEASGDGSTAMGNGTKASGNVSTAMGDNTEASGGTSTAMGLLTAASGIYSTAMGIQTRATGYASTAIGLSTVASGINSTAMGQQTVASGAYSTATGIQTTATGYASTAIGQFNVLNSSDNATNYDATNTAFSIGNGTTAALRSDAFKVLFNGTTTIGTSTPIAGSMFTVNRTSAPTSASPTVGVFHDINYTGVSAGANLYSGVSRLQYSGSTNVGTMIGFNPISRNLGSADVAGIYGMLVQGDSTSNSDFTIGSMFASYAKAKLDGTGTQTVSNQVTGSFILSRVDNPNVTSGAVIGANVAIEAVKGDLGNTSVLYLNMQGSYANPDSSLSIDNFAYIRVDDNFAMPNVTGTSHFINSSVPLPSAFAGSVTSESLNVTALNTAPASATATGTLGSIKFTADHIYVCVATNTWKRVAIATF
jgi:hypothetical protein